MLTHLQTRPPLARDIMSNRLVTVSPTTDVAAAIHLLLKHDISGMPVVDAEGIYRGVISEKCCMKVLCETANLVVQPGMSCPRAGDFMETRPFCLRPEQDIFDAIGALLRHRRSSALVTTPDGTFQGLFSEKTGLQFVLEAVWNGLPAAQVGAFMDVDAGRFINTETDLLTVARMFIKTHYRRLSILRDGQVLGQLGRRDVLRSSPILATIIRYEIEKGASEDTHGRESRIFLDAHHQLPCTAVSTFMDTEAITITEDQDLLSIAQMFRSTTYRRLPVIRDGRAVGQVSRRDVLAAVYHLPDVPQTYESQTLYLSALRDHRLAD